jgi:hypothetical protein
MTICIGLIPNKNSVMLIQDSEVSYLQLGFTQDIFNKIRDIDSRSITGVIGSSLIGNEVLEKVRGGKYETSKSLRDAVEEAYHYVREEKTVKAVLSKYGFRSMRDVTMAPKEVMVDPMVREELLKAANDHDNGFGLSLMLASNIDRPQLYAVSFPGVGRLEDNVKMYLVSGSGTILAIDQMGEELERYRWQKELSIDEGIDVLMRAGKRSEKHTGVGGPFEITYISKDTAGAARIVRPDQKKINMVMYLFPLGVDKEVMLGCIERMRNEEVKAEELAEHIRSNVRVGVEFDRYFALK